MATITSTPEDMIAKAAALVAEAEALLAAAHVKVRDDIDQRDRTWYGEGDLSRVRYELRGGGDADCGTLAERIAATGAATAKGRRY